MNAAGTMYENETIERWHTRTVRNKIQGKGYSGEKQWEIYRREFEQKFILGEEAVELTKEQWNTMVKRETETVKEYHDRFEQVEEAMLVQHGGVPPAVDWEAEKVHKFIRGLPDNIRVNVVNHTPKTVEEAVRQAKRVESIGRGRQPERHQKPRKNVAVARPATVAAMQQGEGQMGSEEQEHQEWLKRRERERRWEEAEWREDEQRREERRRREEEEEKEEEYWEMKRRVDQQEAEIAVMRAGAGGRWGGGRGGGREGRAGGGRQDARAGNRASPDGLKCYRCGALGHLYSACPVPYNSVRCEYCNITGHVTSVCNNRRAAQNANANQGSGGGGPGGGSGGGAGGSCGGGGAGGRGGGAGGRGGRGDGGGRGGRGARGGRGLWTPGGAGGATDASPLNQ